MHTSNSTHLRLIVVVGALIGVPGIWGSGATGYQPQTFSVTASVFVGRGEAVDDLTPAAVQVRLGAQSQPVVAVTRDPRPVAVVIMMSGVESEDALYARATLSSVLKRLRQVPGTRVGLMLGEGGARAPVLVDAFEGADELNRRVSRFFRSEVTAPPQELLAGAVEALAREETHRRVALILSVNRRTDRIEISDRLIPEIRNADVTLVALEASAKLAAVDPALRMIQSVVGGRFEQFSDVTALESAAVRVTAGMLNAYQVTFTIDGPPAGALTVQVTAPPRATVIAPAWAMAARQ